jgi:hypothetical protein
MSNLNFPGEFGESPNSAAGTETTNGENRGTSGADPRTNGGHRDTAPQESPASASSIAAEAGAATHEVVDVAKQETRSVASEAGRQAKKLAGQVRDEFRDQAATQQTRVADGLHSVGSAFTSMAGTSTDGGYAPQLVRAAGERVDSVADWLGTRDPGVVIDDVRRFARRRPGVFIAIAVGAGVVIGRLTRALATPSTEHDADASATPSGNGFDAPPAPPLRRATPPASNVRTSGAGSVGTVSAPVPSASYPS